MQPVSTALFNVLESGINSNPADPVRDLSWLFEFYDPSVLPGVDGFDPTLASQRFAMIETTWLTLAYRRIVLSASDIQIRSGKEANSCTLRLSNADENRYAATWITQNQVEGMWLVVRLISRSASALLTDSTIRFIGRCDKPDGFNVIQGSIAAKSGISTIDYEFPPRLYQADDPEGRSPVDPLHEGFPHIVLNGTFTHLRPEQDRNYNRRDSRRYFATLPWSSYDDTPLGEAIQMILGRTQVRTYRGVFADSGRVTTCIDFIGMGPIADILNFRMDNPPEYQAFFTQPENVTYHLGEAGGTGTQIHDPLWPNHPYFSYTAYVGYSFRYIGNGAFSQIDAGHDTVMIVLGMVMPLPNASGVFNTEGWTDDGAIQTRFLVTNERFFNLNEAFIEDSACYATAVYNAQPTLDDSNAEEILIPNVEIPSPGDDLPFPRVRSTGLIGVERARYSLGLDLVRPEAQSVTGDYVSYNIDSPPQLLTDVRRLRKRFTTNVLLRKRVRGLDFLYNTILPSFRGYLPWNYKGKLEIRSERPADFAHLRAATVPTATTILIEDATSWKATGGLWGKVLIGAGLTTSEVRKVTAAAYTTDANAITLTASVTGTVTATASGATLAGGSSSAQATGTVTVGGTAQAGAQVSTTIQGIQVAHTLTSDDTLATAAYMLAAHINANTQLRRFVSATASGAVVTVTSKWGVLTLTSALVNAHTGPVANPTTAPAGITGSSSGSSLGAGAWRVAYANRNARGSTYISPHSTVTLTAGQRINIPALAFPAGVTSRDWFISKAAGDTEIVLHTNNTTALGFAVTTPPSSTAAFPPEYNTTGEEAMRVAQSFASNNQTAAILAQAGLTRGNIFDQSYRWPNSGQQPTFTEVVGNYVDAADDFAASKVAINDKVLRERIGKVNPLELDLTAVDGWPQARRLVYYYYSKNIDHHWFNSLGSNGLALLLEEMDVICSSDDSGGHVNVTTRVEEFTIHLENFTVSIQRARLYSTAMFRELVPKTQPLLPSVLQWVATLNTNIQLLDIPFFRERDAAAGPGILAAIRRAPGTGDWRGETHWINTGEGYKQIGEWDVEATTGEALTALPDHSAGLDTTSTVRIRLADEPLSLSTATDDELGAGANLFRLAGEIFQAQTLTLVGGTTTDYDLTNLRRGLYGTEGETGTHIIGDEFTVLDGAVFHIPIDSKYVGSEIAIKSVTVNQDLADATEILFDWEGRSMLPLAPARVELEDGTDLAPRDAAGNVLISPWPRSNIQHTGDEYRVDYLTDVGDEIEGAFEVFREDAPQPALIISSVPALSSSKFYGVTSTVRGNTFSFAGSVSGARARSLQKIRAEGNFAEATLRGGADMTITFGLMAAGKDWRIAIPEYRFVMGAGGLGQSLEVRYSGDTISTGTLLYTEDPTSYSAAGKRFRFRLLGNKVQFFKDYEDESTPPLTESIIVPNYPLLVVMEIGIGSLGSGHVEHVTLSTNPLPATILTAAQQTLWYGGLKSPVRVRIRQHSGIREVGYGFPFEGTI